MHILSYIFPGGDKCTVSEEKGHRVKRKVFIYFEKEEVYLAAITQKNHTIEGQKVIVVKSR
jgi:hypothetical protein